MKSQSRKSKGRELQKFVANFLKVLYTWREGDAESRPMGSSGVDIMMSPKARDEFPFSIECKNWKAFPSLPALEQSDHNKYADTLASVVWKPKGKGMSESIIYFNFEEFSAYWKKHTLNGDIPVEVKDEEA